MVSGWPAGQRRVMTGTGRSRRLRLWLSAVVGGEARLRVIVLLALVLALQSADSATVGSVAVPLERSLQIDNVQLGLLVTVSSLVGAIATLPAGVLIDRLPRVRLLSTAVVLWSLAMLVSGFATSFLMLLVTRIALGIVVAVAGPAIASLTGDLFPAQERGRMFGYILFGELLGAGLGYLVAGNLASVLSWRASFIFLSVPSVLLGLALVRLLPEPARGGQSRIEGGDTEIVPAPEQPDDTGDATEDEQEIRAAEGKVEQGVRAAHIRPHRDLVLHEDPVRMGTWRAFRYVLSVRTNVLLISASTIGYFFYGGLEVFAVEFLRGRFDLDQSTASTLLVVIGGGAVLGVLVGGPLADRLITAGILSGRVLLAGLAFLGTAAVLLPGLLVTSLLIGGPLLFLGAAIYGGTNPSLDAGRLDVMQHHLWGRAEAIRTSTRSLFTATAPLVFGLVSTRFGGRSSGLAGATGSRTAGVAVQRGAHGLDVTFLLMLVPLALAGLALVVIGRRTYPRDVATAMASERATRHAHE
jgi:predicted MFS family arabinose efflux permease